MLHVVSESLCDLYENGARFISNSYGAKCRFGPAKQGPTAVTIRQLSQREFVHTQFSAWKHRTVARKEKMHRDSGKLHVHIAHLPSRPDRTVLSDSIPLFFIGRNRSGFWVARESKGRSGGLFLFRSSATRFASNKSSPRGCATMIVEHTVELDIPNQGNRVVELIGTMIDSVRRRAPLVATFVGMAIAALRKLDSQISQLLADHRRSRDAIENELFRGEYKLVSKNDDDLPISR